MSIKFFLRLIFLSPINDFKHVKILILKNNFQQNLNSIQVNPIFNLYIMFINHKLKPKSSRSGRTTSTTSMYN
jgi:hypothetical protein